MPYYPMMGGSGDCRPVIPLTSFTSSLLLHFAQGFHQPPGRFRGRFAQLLLQDTLQLLILASDREGLARRSIEAHQRTVAFLDQGVVRHRLPRRFDGEIECAGLLVDERQRVQRAAIDIR